MADRKISATTRRSGRKLHIGVGASTRESSGAYGFTVRNYTVSTSPSINRLAEVLSEQNCDDLEAQSHDSNGNQSAIMDTRIPDNIATPSPSIMPSAITITAKAGMLLPNGIGRKIRSPFTATMIPTMRSCRCQHPCQSRHQQSLCQPPPSTGAVNLTRSTNCARVKLHRCASHDGIVISVRPAPSLKRQLPSWPLQPAPLLAVLLE